MPDMSLCLAILREHAHHPCLIRNATARVKALRGLEGHSFDEELRYLRTHHMIPG